MGISLANRRVRVLTIPGRLWLSASMLLLCIPWVALETILVDRAPWWDLPWLRIAAWSLLAAVVFLPLFAFVIRGSKPALRVAGVLAVLWCAASLWISIADEKPGVGFFTLFLGLYWLVAWGWMKHELDRSFFDPRLAWYQGLPRPLAGLGCTVGGLKPDLRVCRIDKEGAFIFFAEGSTGESEGIALPNTGEKVELVFHFRGREIRCLGTPVRILAGESARKWLGAGFQFVGMTADHRKALGDFIEALRGEGYA